MCIKTLLSFDFGSILLGSVVVSAAFYSPQWFGGLFPLVDLLVLYVLE